MKKKLQIGLLEIGIFGSSLVMMGLVFWLLSLTMFGSSQNSEARLLTSLGAAPAAMRAPGVLKQVLPASEQKLEGAVFVEKEEAAPQYETQAMDQSSIPAAELVAPALEAPPAPIAVKAEAIPVPKSEPVNAIVPPPPAVSAPPAVTDPPSAPLPVEPEPSQKSTIYTASARDPMLRPEEQAALERLKKEREEAAKAFTARPEPKAAPVDSVKRKVNVQGIMDTPEGIVAIINNDIYRRGDTVAGAKILRILGNRVQFKYRENIFEKSVEE